MTAAGVTQFADTPGIEGPGGIDEPEFLSALGRLGIPYRIVETGLMRAVTPDRAVTPKQIGLLGS